MTPRATEPVHGNLIGAAAAAAAFTIWGLSPLYWKLLKTVPAFEILMHRMVWSFVLLLPLAVFRQREELLLVVKNMRTLSILVLTTVLVSGNWFLYIWAINTEQVLQTSLGYFICPLTNVLLGMLFLGERLRRLQIVALVIATSAVLILTLHIGQPPWLALLIAATFSFYGLLRKVVAASALVGLTIETLILTAPAVAYLIYLDRIGSGAFVRAGPPISLLLAGGALVTAIPLLLFTFGARRLFFHTLGFLQYITPSCSFLLGVFVFSEPFTAVQALSFALIWFALAIFSFDSVIYQRRSRH